MQRVLFIPCTVDGLPSNSGSAMIRTRWVAKYWPGAEVFDGTQTIGQGWELVVFQKAYLSEKSQALIHSADRLRGAYGWPWMALDMCDPDWLDGRHKRRLLDVLPLFDFAVAPTWPLIEWLVQYLPAYLVPDRLDPQAFTVKREFFNHDGPPSLGWIGYAGHREALATLLPVVQELGLDLRVLGVSEPVSFEKFLQKLVEFDVLLNPRPLVAPWMYKSENKSLVAWAAGVAVAENGDDLRDLADPERRGEFIQQHMENFWHKYHARQAVDAWLRALGAELAGEDEDEEATD